MGSPCVPALLQRAIRRFAADKATKVTLHAYTLIVPYADT
jgi:hypothetical protein